mmetsp:Transcript_146801/g.471326  ORF Transcript_146801/g.471326 Transcript_146801/m.471326 type:complete len:209 (+) Transcript_146801:1210-1836(+)
MQKVYSARCTIGSAIRELALKFQAMAMSSSPMSGMEDGSCNPNTTSTVASFLRALSAAALPAAAAAASVILDDEGPDPRARAEAAAEAAGAEAEGSEEPQARQRSAAAVTSSCTLCDSSGAPRRAGLAVAGGRSEAQQTASVRGSKKVPTAVHGSRACVTAAPPMPPVPRSAAPTPAASAVPADARLALRAQRNASTSSRTGWAEPLF